MKIDLGEKDPRQLVAGLKQHYKPEELKGKKLIVISNLEPAVLRGEKSEGMLLAAGEKEVGVLYAEKSANGSLVFTERTKQAVSEKDGKELKKVSIDSFQKITIEAKVGMGWFDGEELKTEQETVKVDKKADGKVR